LNYMLREGAPAVSGTDQRVIIEPTALGEREHRYRVTYAGSNLIESSRVPALDVCRALLALGITGQLEAWRPGKAWPDMQLDIEAGSKLTVIETEKEGPRFAPWRSFSDPTQDAVSSCTVSPQTRASEFRYRNLSEKIARPGAPRAGLTRVASTHVHSAPQGRSTP